MLHIYPQTHLEKPHIVESSASCSCAVSNVLLIVAALSSCRSSQRQVEMQQTDTKIKKAELGTWSVCVESVHHLAYIQEHA